MKFLIWTNSRLLNCKRCKGKLGCRCGGGSGGGGDAPATPDPVDVAQQQLEAQQATTMPAAQLNFDILKQFLLPTTQLQEQVRQDTFPGENAVRNQLIQNITQALSSPRGLTQGQGDAISSSRGQAFGGLSQALAGTAGLGGPQLGGDARQLQEEGLGDLAEQFSESDIASDEGRRLNAIQSALPMLSTLYPQANIARPQFMSAAASPDAIMQGLLQQQGQAAQLQGANAQAGATSQAGMYSGIGATVGMVALAI